MGPHGVRVSGPAGVSGVSEILSGDSAILKSFTHKSSVLGGKEKTFHRLCVMIYSVQGLEVEDQQQLHNHISYIV